MEVIKQLASELKIELSFKLAYALLDPLGLDTQIFVIVKSDLLHFSCSPAVFDIKNSILFYHKKPAPYSLERKTKVYDPGSKNYAHKVYAYAGNPPKYPVNIPEYRL